MQTFVARAGEHMGGYPEDELRTLYHQGHFLPTDNYWRDGMTEWGMLSELFPAEGPTPQLESPSVGKVRKPASWIVPTVICVLLVIIGVVITVSYFSRKMAEAAAPAANPPLTFEPRTLPAPLPEARSKPDDLLRVPDAEGDDPARAESETVMKDVERLSTACRESEKDMLLLGFDPARLTSLEEIEKRRQSIAIVLPRVQAVVDYFTKLDDKIRADLQGRSVPAPDIDTFIANMHRNGQQDALLTYWREESDIALTMQENLELLRQNYGKWHLDGETVVFNDPAMLTAYRSNVEKLKADIAQQQTAQAAIKQSSSAAGSSSNP